MKKKLTLKILSLLIFWNILETFTQFCFKKTAISGSNLEIYSFTNLLSFIFAIFSSIYFWFALLSLLITFITWSTILSKIDLSVAVPLASFSYILIPIASTIFLNEKISALRWIAILFILIGVISVSLSEKREKNAD